MTEVFGAYAIAVLLVAIVFVVAFVLGLALRGASYRTRLFLNLIAMVILAIAVLEKAGWSVRPWSLGCLLYTSCGPPPTFCRSTIRTRSPARK